MQQTLTRSRAVVAATRYELTLDPGVRTWQGAFLLSHEIERPRTILVTVHGFSATGDSVEHEGHQWYWSDHLAAGFHYLPAAPAGSVIPLTPVTHTGLISRLVLVARPFTSPTRPVPEVVSTLCFQDLEPLADRRHVVLSAHAPEIIDV